MRNNENESNMNSNRYNNAMEDNDSNFVASHDSGLQYAIESENPRALYDTLQIIPVTTELVTIGLRFQLRDMWEQSRGNFAVLAEGNYENIDKRITEIVGDVDDNITSLSHWQNADVASDDWRKTLLRELDSNSEEGFAMIGRLIHLDTAMLSTPEELLPWVRDWRNRIVQILWENVQDYREEGMTTKVQASFDQAFAEVNDHLSRLSKGAIDPEGNN